MKLSITSLFIEQNGLMTTKETNDQASRLLFICIILNSSLGFDVYKRIRHFNDKYEYQFGNQKYSTHMYFVFIG